MYINVQQEHKIFSSNYVFIYLWLMLLLYIVNHIWYIILQTLTAFAVYVCWILLFCTIFDVLKSAFSKIHCIVKTFYVYLYCHVHFQILVSTSIASCKIKCLLSFCIVVLIDVLLYYKHDIITVNSNTFEIVLYYL